MAHAPRLRVIMEVPGHAGVARQGNGDADPGTVIGLAALAVVALSPASADADEARDCGLGDAVSLIGPTWPAGAAGSAPCWCGPLPATATRSWYSTRRCPRRTAGRPEPPIRPPRAAAPHGPSTTSARRDVPPRRARHLRAPQLRAELHHRRARGAAGPASTSARSGAGDQHVELRLTRQPSGLRGARTELSRTRGLGCAAVGRAAQRPDTRGEARGLRCAAPSGRHGRPRPARLREHRQRAAGAYAAYLYKVWAVAAPETGWTGDLGPPTSGCAPARRAARIAPGTSSRGPPAGSSGTTTTAATAG